MGLVRVLLAISVLLAHSGDLPLTGNHLVGGVVAVQCFYIISGFYMALVLTQRYASSVNFYFNRFLRLYPTYWFLLVASIASCLAFSKPTFVGTILNSSVLHWDSKTFMLFANFFIFGSDAMMFMFPSPDGLRFTADFNAHAALLYPFHFIPQAWTLPVEMTFYAIAPLIAKRPPALIVIITFSIAARYLTYAYISTGDPWNYRFFPSEAAFFCVGALAFHVYAGLRDFRGSQEIGLVLFVVLILYITGFNRVPVLVGNTFLFGGNLLQFYGLVMVALPFVFSLTSRNRIDRWLGELSYPIYLTHHLVIEGANHLPRYFNTFAYNVILNTILASAAINLFVQAPVEKFFKRPVIENAA